MKQSNPIEINLASDRGMMLAYFRKAVFLESYSKENLEARLTELEQKNGSLLELHLFDEKKEFRAILKENGTYIQAVVEDTPDMETVMEEMYVESSFAQEIETIKVVNYLEYKENGMLQVVNYRLML